MNTHFSQVSSILRCKQRYKSFDISPGLVEESGNIYGRGEVTFSVFLLYLQYLSLILVDTIDFGVWGKLMNVFKILSDLFVFSDMSVGTEFMELYVIISLIFISLLFCSCFDYTQQEEQDKNADSIVHSYNEGMLNDTYTLCCCGCLIIFPSLISSFFNADVSYVLFTVGFLCCMCSFLKCLRGGLHYVLGMSADELMLHLFILKVFIYVPLSTIFGNSLVALLISEEDLDRIDFLKTTLLVLSLLIFSIFIFDCFMIYYINDTKLIPNPPNSKYDADLRVTFLILPFFIIERVAFSLFGSILGNEDYQENLIANNITSEEIAIQLPFYGFLFTLGITTGFLFYFRPFYSQNENQLQIYPRLSHIMLIIFVLLRDYIGKSHFQLILFFLISFPVLIFFLLKFKLWNFCTQIESGAEKGNTYIRTLESMVVFNTYKEEDPEVTDNLEFKLSESDEAWRSLSTYSKIYVIEHESDKEDTNYDFHTCVLNINRFHSCFLSRNQSYMSIITELQFSLESTNEIMFALKNSFIAKFDALTSITLYVTKEYQTNNETLAPISTLLEYNIISLCLIYEPCEKIQPDDELVINIANNTSLRDLIICNLKCKQTVRTILKCLPKSLTGLSMSYCSGIENLEVKEIKKLVKLEYLYLGMNDLSSNDIDYFLTNGLKKYSNLSKLCVTPQANYRSIPNLNLFERYRNATVELWVQKPIRHFNFIYFEDMKDKIEFKNAFPIDSYV